MPLIIQSWCGLLGENGRTANLLLYKKSISIVIFLTLPLGKAWKISHLLLFLFQSDASDSDVASKHQNQLVHAASNGQMSEVIGGIALGCPGPLEEDNADQLQWTTGLGKGAFCS